MTDSDDATGQVADSTAERQAEAQAAADGLKDQIAAVRARVHKARDALHAHARRRDEPKSFRR